MAKRKKISKIDILPNWQQTMSVYTFVLINGNDEGKKEAVKYLMDLGKRLDQIKFKG